MRFLINGETVLLVGGGQQLTCSIAEFTQLEPGFTYSEGYVESWETSRAYLSKDGHQKASSYDRSAYLAKIAEYIVAIKAVRAATTEESEEPDPEPKSDWEGSLIAIHQSLAAQSPVNPFVQIRLWAKQDISLSPSQPLLDSTVKEFISAFTQPQRVVPQAVESAFFQVWQILDSARQSELNKSEIAAWNETYDLGLLLPWPAG